MVGNLISSVRHGYVLADPATWKNRTIAVNALVALLSTLVALANAFGWSLPLSDEDLAALAGSVFALVGVFNAWSTAATSEKVGLLPGGRDPDQRNPDEPADAPMGIG